MIRSVVSIVLGLVVGGTTVAILKSLGHWLVPPPEGLDPTDVDSIRQHMSEIAPGALVAVLAAYAGGSFVGAAVAGQIAKRVPICHGLIVGGLLMAGGVVTMFAIPHPLWFRIAGLLVFLPSAWWGAYSVNPPMPGQHEGWVPKPVPFVKSKEP